MGCSGIIRHTYRVPNATFVQTHYFIVLFPIFVNICDIAIIGNVYVLLCLKKLLQWAARWPPFIILTGQQVMEAAPAKYIFMRGNTSFETNIVFPILRYSTSSPKCLFLDFLERDWRSKYLLLQSLSPPWSKIFSSTKLISLLLFLSP